MDTEFWAEVATIIGLPVSLLVAYIGARKIANEVRCLVGEREILVVSQKEKVTRVLTKPGELFIQNPLSERVRTISWGADSREVAIKRAGKIVTLAFDVRCLTHERLKATLRCNLYLNEPDSMPALVAMYDHWSSVLLEAERAVADMVSTLSVGDIRPRRMEIQKHIEKSVPERFKSLNVSLHKAAISSIIEFDDDIELALANEANVRLKGRARIAQEELNNKVNELSARGEAKNRVLLAKADAEGISHVGPALKDPREAARLMVMMRYAYELSRLGPNVVQDVSFSKLLDTIRELLGPRESTVVEEVKTSTSSRPRGN